MKFRKKPVVIEATQWFKDGDHPSVKMMPPDQGAAPFPYIATLEGPMVVSSGDWIITGVKGEHYACKPDIFEMTYEPASFEAKTAFVHLPQDPDRFIALQSGDRLTVEARNPVPTAAVVRQLVDGLAGLIDFIEIDNLKIDQDALRIARVALSAAREVGL